MTFSIRATIRALAAREHRISCSSDLWRTGLVELRRRGRGERESGAFLLGQQTGARRSIQHFVYYDELDPHCLDTGIVVFDGAAYGPLWQLCREKKLHVVADVHVHGGVARQSTLDRDNPMIARSGHIAIIVPDLARQFVGPEQLGIYEYEGEHRWRQHSGADAKRFFYVRRWG